MRKTTTTTAKNQRTSKFLGNRRRRLLNHSKKEMLVLPDVPNPTKENQKGNIYAKRFKEGFYQVRFFCKKTKRSAIGYGADLTLAVLAMSDNFLKKYNSHGR
ncbi:hypothetical protein [Chryseobacterium sp. 2R14A]|uniref:hypothetical protein n=1 Tax=Chryseobacterium sp. 2R14A TaxID=3380353 RepID=UPI003CFB29BB